MVQRPTQTPQGEYFPRDNWPRGNERTFLDIPDGRFATPQQIHGRELTIEQALKDCVRIPVKEFALAVVLESGEERVYSSPSLAKYRERFFGEQFKAEFHRSIRKAAREGVYPSSGRFSPFSAPAWLTECGGASTYSPDGNSYEFDVDSGHETFKSSGGSSSELSSRRRHQSRISQDSDDDVSPNSKRNKRPRGSFLYGESSNEETPQPVPVIKKQQLKIGDSEQVDKFYQQRFKDMQQSSCKVMGKAFVKLVEPKKQTHHPYTKGDEQAPSWWPNTTGPNHVRHKEPDHLLKPERVRLLIHILKMVIEPPNNQHSSVLKLGLNVQKLEEVTMEAMSNWFNDKEHPDNATKKSFLKEIFKVARAEERYKNGEIDGTTCIPVSFGEATSGDGEDDDGEEEFKAEDDEHELISVSASIPTPESLVSPSLGSSQHEEPTFTNMRRPLPVRHHTQPAIEEANQYDSFYHQRMFQPQSPNFHDQGRRQSFVSSPSYNSPQQNMFTGWQGGNMVSNGPLSSNYYTASPTSLPPASGPYLPLPITQPSMLPPPPMVSHFDGLNGRPYDSGPALGSQVRTGSLGHPHHLSHGYAEFMNDNPPVGQHDSDWKDDQHLQSR